MTGFLSEPDLRLFLRDGLVIGLSGLFRSTQIPLGISVEDHVLEIVGSDSESGLITGDFAIPEGFALTPTHATRGLVAKTPYFPEIICCLAHIMRETGDSGHSPGWDDTGKIVTIPNESRESS
jgi:hypothetical protein